MKRFLLFILCSVVVLAGVVGFMRPPASAAQARVSRPTQFGTGLNFACALSEAGTVKCWGSNAYGVLGSESTSFLGEPGISDGASLPIVDLGSHTAKSLTVGNLHVCVILDNGAVACWGNNDLGQLGIGSTLSRGDDSDEMGTDLITVDLGTHSKKIRLYVENLYRSFDYNTEIHVISSCGAAVCEDSRRQSFLCLLFWHAVPSRSDRSRSTHVSPLRRG